MKRYAVSFVCSADKLNTILGLIDGEIDELMISQEAAPNGAAGVGYKSTTFESSRTARLVYDAMIEGHVYAAGDFRRTLADAGFKETSASPTMSLLAHCGKVEKVGRNGYRRRPA